MSPRRYRSFRWKSGPDYDADAYFLEEGDWFVFVVLKNAALEWNALIAELMQTFDRGALRGIGGALKTKEMSEPLPAVPCANGTLPEALWCHEDGLQFRLETANVLNPGLFLDQEKNRERLADLIAERVEVHSHPGAFRLLNLFSFTGAFSVVASSHGLETTSVDLSARYLEWEKRNQAQNSKMKKWDWGDHIPKMHLVREDARVYLRRAAVKAERYSWIILDPPTFSRGAQGVFQVNTDLAPMVETAVTCLDKKGSILVSTNDARWRVEDFAGEMASIAGRHGMLVERGELPEEFLGLDPPYPMKSLWLHIR